MVSMTYDTERSEATLSFQNGRKLKISGVSKEQADAFVARHADEFERRDCVLHTDGTFEVRENG